MALWTLFTLFALAAAHGGHDSGKKPDETIQQYAQRHMSSEHHIDDFDIRSFFQLHDLDRDGFWSKEEIEAIYGVHHIYSQKKSKDDEEHQKKADYIVSEILKRLDGNGDGRVSPEELETIGLDGLPNFNDLGAEGHHYDVESEFFLHHEEEFHSTPETQTDDSYIHAEDYEHFAHHEKIERQEAEKEAKYQGVSVDEILKQQEEAEAAAAEAAKAREFNEKIAGQHPFVDPNGAPPPPVQEPSGKGVPEYTRNTPPEKQDPTVRFKDAKSQAEAKDAWGQGADGFKPPKEAGDRMRKNLPYKVLSFVLSFCIGTKTDQERMQYKFKRSWGDF
ncbi:precursor to secretory protein Ssp120 [Flagelloscypha sp. PMI_526]|nr:precursor to secretory protein Ssp120 [Flagelloscypha sp. PMI_526]